MPAVFLDLNGTLVTPVQVTHPTELTALPNTGAAVRLLTLAGFACPVITVQSRISKGVFSLQDFLHWFAGFQGELSRQGATLYGPYVCPHAGRDGCACKKPKTRLYTQAAEELGVDAAQSVVVGDDIADLLAARHLGCRACLVRTGWGTAAIERYRADQIADFVAADILDAARWIVSHGRRGQSARAGARRPMSDDGRG